MKNTEERVNIALVRQGTGEELLSIASVRQRTGEELVNSFVNN